MSTTYSPGASVTLATSIKHGVLAGLGGGLVFGIMMAMMGSLPMVGMLVGQDSAVVGFIVHMLISACFGGVFGLFAARFLHGRGATLIAGALYGVVIWVVGALLLMPLMLGMNDMVFQIGQAQWLSLLGHLVFGVVTAAIVNAFSA